jgi:carboxyl-terminal processing protease
LALFADGKKLQLNRTISRGEALQFMVDFMDVSGDASQASVAARFTDVHTPSDIALVSLTLSKQWMKAQSLTYFGLGRPLRGREAKLFLRRVFTTGDRANDGKETITVPVVRVQFKGTSVPAVFPQEQKINEVWNILRGEYLYPENVSPDKAGDAAIQSIVNSIGDPYTTYMPKKRNDDFKQQMKGEVEGIGATVEMTGGILTIVSPIRKSPAEKAGLQPRDQILSVDGVVLKDMSLDEAVSKVRGPRDTEVLLHVRRGSDEFDVRVKREKITIPEVEITRDRNVAIIRILQFWDTTDTKFREAVSKIANDNPRGIILDLRNNPGGLLHAAGVVVSAFVPKGTAYVQINERSNKSTEVTNDEPVVKDSIPMIVLVNKGSASASEIVAGALQDSHRARVVGETSYGKGTVQQILEFNDGSSLKYTIAEWLTPNGRHINKVGITPDVSVMNDQKSDTQYEKAMDLLR